METIKAILTILSPIAILIFVHYTGYKWARKNPGKLYIEYFFEVEKKPNNEQNVQESDTTEADSSTSDDNIKNKTHGK